MEMSRTLKDDNNEGFKPDVFIGDTSAKDKDLVAKANSWVSKTCSNWCWERFQG